jgi:hypothetical protein
MVYVRSSVNRGLAKHYLIVPVWYMNEIVHCQKTFFFFGSPLHPIKKYHEPTFSPFRCYTNCIIIYLPSPGLQPGVSSFQLHLPRTCPQIHKLHVNILLDTRSSLDTVVSWLLTLLGDEASVSNSWEIPRLQVSVARGLTNASTYAMTQWFLESQHPSISFLYSHQPWGWQWQVPNKSRSIKSGCTHARAQLPNFYFRSHRANWSELEQHTVRPSPIYKSPLPWLSSSTPSQVHLWKL